MTSVASRYSTSGKVKKKKKKMNAPKATADRSEHEQFILFVEKDYGKHIAEQVEQELAGHHKHHPSESDALAKVLAGNQGRMFSMTASFSSTPLPMEYDGTRRRR